MSNNTRPVISRKTAEQAAEAPDEQAVAIPSDEDTLVFGAVAAKTEEAPDAANVSELLKTVMALQSKIEQLEAGQAETARKVDADYDMMDDLLFIAKPGGEKWTERRIIDKKAVEVEQVATAFFGPFNDAEQVELYLGKKRTQRDGAEYDWENVRILKGREARAIRRRESEEREQRYAGVTYTNVLDRRIFAAQQGNHTPTLGTLVGPA